MTPWEPRALALLHHLNRQGYPTYFVGGCVRDHLLHRIPHDYDLATAALPHQVMDCCSFQVCRPTALKYGTVTVLWDDLPIQVTTFRRDGHYTQHRIPIRPTFTQDVMEDLARRDFTINGMAWNGETLLDPFGGHRDLQRGLLRMIGCPQERLEEDALRILRGLRFASQLSFTLEDSLAQAITHCLPLVDCLSEERKLEELLPLLCGSGLKDVLSQFPQVVSLCIPELQGKLPPWWIQMVQSLPPTPVLRLAALLRPLASCSSSIQHLQHSLPLSRPLRQQLEQRLAPVPFDPEDLLPTLPQAICQYGPLYLLDCCHLAVAQRRAQGLEAGSWETLKQQVQQLMEHQPCLTRKALAISGRDVIQAGYSGPMVGTILESLLIDVIAGRRHNHREELLSLLPGFRSLGPPQTPSGSKDSPTP